jgi:DNA phosphorothioation-associated putative methyltransferase
MSSGVKAPLGKKVGGALYLHVDALGALPEDDRRSVDQARAIVGAEGGDHNVVKLGRDRRKVSLLTYAEFFKDPFPALVRSVSVDLAAGAAATRTYDPDRNPPILHRKELLLPTDHPSRAGFEALTRDLERANLYEQSAGIGHRKQWWRRLHSAGYTVRGHALVASAEATERDTEESGSTVDRHKTAISRNQLSGPMQALARHGFLEGDRDVLDYGCGRGDDVTVLTAAGISARGWDPYYAPDAPLAPADVVNLGFVLNVIENPGEREQALSRAYELTRQVLAVAVLTVGRADVSGLEPYRDGFLTARRTFQKYFTQQEARDLIAGATRQEAIPVAPGVFLVFRDKLEEQRFLARRSRRRDISHLLSIAPPAASEATRAPANLTQEQRDLLREVWHHALERGRIPHGEEIPEDLDAPVRAQIGSLRKAVQLAQAQEDPSQLTAARDLRMADLRVYFALNLFNRRPAYRQLPAELQRDVKAFFGSYRQANEAGEALLYSVNEPETLLSACQEAAENDIGHLFADHSLQVHAAQAGRLPEILRTYIGCAEKLFGTIDEETTDLIKIHIYSGKLTLLRFDDFFGKPLPRLVERIKIKMRQQDVDFFDHADDKAAPRLTLKSRYMSPDQEGYSRQRAFDEQLVGLGLFDLEGYGPDAATLARGLTRAGYRVAGFEIVPASYTYPAESKW